MSNFLSERHFLSCALGLPFIILVMVLPFPAFATGPGSKACRAFFVDSGKSNISTTKTNQERASYISYSLEQLFNIKLDSLSPREKSLLAKATDYLESHEAQTAAELVALGAPKKEVVELVKRVVRDDLSELESQGQTIRLFHDRQEVSFEREASLSHSPFKTLEEFSIAYKLTPERTTISTMIFDHKLSRRVDPVDVLKAAMMTKDLDLMNRAFEQALKFGKFDSLTAIASKMQNNKYLIELGRLSIARYLFFDRNHNWLSNGLRSFSEVTGKDKQYVEQMLYDLYDTMLSPAILANESKVRTYNDESSLSAYTSDAVNVLKTTLPMVQRMKGDSSPGFNYTYSRTDKPQYVDRLKSLLDKLIENNENIWDLSSGIIQIQNPSILLHIAHKAEVYSKKVNPKFDERHRKFIVDGATQVARDAFVMSGDLYEIKNYMNRFLKDRRSSLKSAFGFVLGENSLLAPKKVVDFFRSLLANPTKLSKSTTIDDLSNIKSWLESYDYEVSQHKEEVSAASKIFYNISFKHEVDSIKWFLSRGEGASLEKNKEFRARGEEMLEQHDYWKAMSEFISAKDIDGLERTYRGMLTRGRPLDAVYAALAIEWIQTGQPLLLGHKLNLN
ncbi:hypothetical protein N9W41_00530 [bacterium]|nr:hypothetical protein [bacterium]